MIKFETINELTLKVTTTGNDVIFTKTGAFIAGDCSGNTNYRFEKVLLGPQKSLAQAALGSLMRRVTGENIPLTKVTMNGPSETYYAESAQHVLVYKLEPGETILFLACVVMWFLGGFGFTDGGFGMVEDSADSLMAAIGGVIAPIFAPLGFGEWQPVAASISGFTAKEAIVSTMGVLANVAGDTEDAVNVAAGVASWFPTGIAAFSFLMFNLLDSPCLAAIATMAKEMNDKKWFWFAILFQNVFAYIVCLCFYQIGSFVTGGAFGIGTVVGFVVLIAMLFLLFRPDPYKDQKVYSKRSVQA